MLRSLVLLACSLACIDVYPQRQLVLLKGNKIVCKFSEGESIRFQKKGEDFFRSGTITGIHLDFFKLGEFDTTCLYQIRTIDLKHKAKTGFKTSSSGKKLIIAGLLLLLLDVVNPNQPPTIDEGVAVAASAFVVTGLIMQAWNNDSFRIGRRKKVAFRG